MLMYIDEKIPLPDIFKNNIQHFEAIELSDNDLLAWKVLYEVPPDDLITYRILTFHLKTKEVEAFDAEQDKHFPSHIYRLVSLENNDVLIVGNFSGKRSTKIWNVKNNTWRVDAYKIIGEINIFTKMVCNSQFIVDFYDPHILILSLHSKVEFRIKSHALWELAGESFIDVDLDFCDVILTSDNRLALCFYTNKNLVAISWFQVNEKEESINVEFIATKFFYVVDEDRHYLKILQFYYNFYENTVYVLGKRTSKNHSFFLYQLREGKVEQLYSLGDYFDNKLTCLPDGRILIHNLHLSLLSSETLEGQVFLPGIYPNELFLSSYKVNNRLILFNQSTQCLFVVRLTKRRDFSLHREKQIQYIQGASSVAIDESQIIADYMGELSVRSQRCLIPVSIKLKLSRLEKMFHEANNAEGLNWLAYFARLIDTTSMSYDACVKDALAWFQRMGKKVDPIVVLFFKDMQSLGSLSDNEHTCEMLADPFLELRMVVGKLESVLNVYKSSYPEKFVAPRYPKTHISKACSLMSEVHWLKDYMNDPHSYTFEEAQEKLQSLHDKVRDIKSGKAYSFFHVKSKTGLRAVLEKHFVGDESKLIFK